MNHSTHLSKGSVWPRKYGILGVSTQIAIGAPFVKNQPLTHRHLSLLPSIGFTNLRSARYP